MFNPLFCWHFRQRWSWHCLRQVLQGVLPQYHRPRFVSVKLSLSSSARNCHWTIVTSCNVSAPGDSDIISTTPITQWVKSQELRLSLVEMRYRAQTSAASPIAISFLSFSYVILLSCVHLPYCDTDNTSYGCYVRHIHLVWWDRYFFLWKIGLPSVILKNTRQAIMVCWEKNYFFSLENRFAECNFQKHSANNNGTLRKKLLFFFRK